VAIVCVCFCCGAGLPFSHSHYACHRP